MKNLIEELHKLNNEEEYDVPDDFADKVMARIRKEEKGLGLKYVMPMLSTAAVVMVVAMITTSTSLLRNNDKIALMNESGSSNYRIDEKMNEPNSAYDMTDTLKASQSALGYDKYESINETAENVENKEYSKEEFYSEIADILNTNGVTAKVEGLSVKAKCTKADAEEVLFYYEGQITIEVDGEYVVIK